MGADTSGAAAMVQASAAQPSSPDACRTSAPRSVGVKPSCSATAPAVAPGPTIQVTGPVDAAALRRLARFDLLYGVSALLVLAAGFSRAAWGAKGWAFYAGNPAFWIKIGLFVLIGLLSIPPTLTIRRWRGVAVGGASIAVADTKRLRRWLDAELVALVLIPVFAALMARGIGA